MRRRKIGTVTSDKPGKTVVVRITTYDQHPLYKKYIRKRTNVYAHDEKNEYKTGEKVLIEETRPLSKLKRWRVLRRVR
ncbi:30S ribosomal protein S17 [candidate division WOR-3 bacterium]|nr:30S ribosomal protein S17 [candidate division WOR-3 bacterium]